VINTLLDIIILFVPSLIIGIIVAVLIKGGRNAFLVTYAMGQTIVILTSSQLADEYMVLPTLIYAVSLYMIMFRGSGGGEDQ
jgi:hypothetical protein